VYETAFGACEAGEGAADLCKQTCARVQFVPEIRQ
jgi:hypothetical protein